VLARESLPSSASDFHAEMFCSQRLYEYVIPLSLLWTESDGCERGPTHADIKNLLAKRAEVNGRSRTNDPGDEVEQVFRENSWGAMDAVFPVSTPEGRARVDYFRRLKGLLKFIAGKHCFHNFATGGASPDELVSIIAYICSLVILFHYYFFNVYRQ
jgi:tRNA U38,U39,U40 pseudouridine synthase TruA